MQFSYEGLCLVVRCLGMPSSGDVLGGLLFSEGGGGAMHWWRGCGRSGGGEAVLRRHCRRDKLKRTKGKEFGVFHSE